VAAKKIMMIRHAEKPSDDGAVHGVALNGNDDPKELSVRGWQRAGALARFFAPISDQLTDSRLAKPDVIFASGIVSHGASLRPQNTVLPMSELLGKSLDLRYSVGDEEALVADALATDQTVLISRHHEAIPGIGNRILGNATTCPQKWPGARFDLVWIFEQLPGSDQWSFDQVPQMLLAGDLPETISVSQ